ncbi:molybdopterin molybdenumtransferase MoeA [Streptomyces sp. QHH-9511]|uniref:molybdopterin molybdotransferase MoeA n=1 Tax=Streptomyces sp. QHH-9511 TaxID=2684468 RepID=UPI0013169F1B|nr:molybdopterin molybdotransferase MoeA [Streptomyces sp. QHH-9511]QGZ49821.1 molybdopterin molybdenumtransferase MoeA [Streptomyces sp. QHH-9511]
MTHPQQRAAGTGPVIRPVTGSGPVAGAETGAEPGATSGAEPESDGVDEALALVAPRTLAHRTASPRSAPPGTASVRAEDSPAGVPRAKAERHRATPWPDARDVATRAGAHTGPAHPGPGHPTTGPSGPARPGSSPDHRDPERPRRHATPLGQALGHVLAEPLRALTDLPSFDTSAMDGWAVAGPGPWAIRDEGAVLAGHASATALEDGTAVRIATGARVPPETTAVVRSEHSRTDAGGHMHARREVVPGQDIRPRGQECRSGDQLLPAGTPVTPAVLGLAAAAGYDELPTLPRPRVEILVLGDELLTAGLPHDGLIRDALGPMLGPWLNTLGADVLATRRIGDDADALRAAVIGSPADLVITTGGTAAGPVDHVHPVLAQAGAALLVDGVKVRPGHPMLLARLEGGRHLVGLPGNPLAAISGLLTLAEPLLRALAGAPASTPYRAAVRDEVHGHPHDTRLVPVVHRGDQVVPLHYNGPAMLRGIAAADGMAVVPPGGARPGDVLEILDLPWPVSPAPGAAQGACFT